MLVFQNVASYLISNLQYSNQNSTNNDEETEQNASLCKYFNENSVKSPVNVITNNILLKNLMVNFQNQFDILCLDDQGSSLDILGEENCIQDEQNYISEQQDQMIISPASPSFTHSCVVSEKCNITKYLHLYDFYKSIERIIIECIKQLSLFLNFRMMFNQLILVVATENLVRYL